RDRRQVVDPDTTERVDPRPSPKRSGRCQTCDMLVAGPRPDPFVAQAWRLLSAAGGNTSIAVLAKRLGVTGRHLGRRFDEQVGLTPKTVARILRYERAVALLRSGSGSVAQVAAVTGYSDQAHLTREVRGFAGVPPRALG
ncbi:MAG: helix-turn-helix domain-containing protein, partial [Stackebrandtia sp.]